MKFRIAAARQSVAIVILGLLPLVSHAAENDAFGVAKLFGTTPGGREWFAPWEQERVVRAYERDPQDALLYNEEGELRLGKGVGSVKAGMTRLVVLTPTNVPAKPWRNVEMTVYVRRGKSSRTMDYQALYLSARSGIFHNDSVPCEGTSYHATVRFDGQCGFKKEIWHTGGYTNLRPSPVPKPWPTVPTNQWIGMKFVCRNADQDRHVRLQLYLDAGERNEWKLIAELTDAGGWRGSKPGCDRPEDYIITEGRPAVYFRTDYVDVELKKFSVREIEALP